MYMYAKLSYIYLHVYDIMCMYVTVSSCIC